MTFSSEEIKRFFFRTKEEFWDELKLDRRRSFRVELLSSFLEMVRMRMISMKMMVVIMMKEGR